MSVPFKPDFLPEPFGWMPVSGGFVSLENGQQGMVEGFALATYPITNQQYAVFIDAPDGYIQARWWEYSDDARRFHVENPAPPHTAVIGDDVPRTNVSWYEALAFCRWVSERTGLSVTLPNEFQWQRAAQGDDGRLYPWGNSFDPARCTFNIKIEGAASVTAHPDGASPFGVREMSGNVWEWCLNDYYTGSTDVTGFASDRVLRGGSWWCVSPDDLTTINRSGGYQHGWSHDWGFRVACNF